MNFKKLASLMMMFVLVLGLVACNNTTETTETTDTTQEEVAEETTTEPEVAEETEETSDSDFDNSAEITVVSREDGSGTRGAFTEITGVLAEVGDEEEDQTSVEAMIQNSTNGVMTAVEGDPNAIGYISLGSLNDSVKPVSVEGVSPEADLVKSGEYKVARPFNVAYQTENIGEIGQDLLNFILSSEGQSVVEEAGYVMAINDGEEYTPSGLEGQITVTGSTSVSPVMEKLVEAYNVHNPDVVVDIQSVGSSAGMTAAMEGTANLGMASRELKNEELEALEHTAIAIDGIAVIVNNENPLEDLTMEQVRQIFVGEITTWSELE